MGVMNGFVDDSINDGWMNSFQWIDKPLIIHWVSKHVSKIYTEDVLEWVSKQFDVNDHFKNPEQHQA